MLRQDQVALPASKLGEETQLEDWALKIQLKDQVLIPLLGAPQTHQAIQTLTHMQRAYISPMQAP